MSNTIVFPNLNFIVDVKPDLFKIGDVCLACGGRNPEDSLHQPNCPDPAVTAAVRPCGPSGGPSGSAYRVRYHGTGKVAAPVV